ncbi:MAG: hypothetical protein HOY71_26690 [Nonomuraea sp.]|nr:hypothetical protein [Nonomuraea sp.]
MFVGLAVSGLLCMEMTHKSVTAAERTTLTSVASLASQAGGAGANLGFGALATVAGAQAAWVVAGGIVLASALLFAGLRDPSRT